MTPLTASGYLELIALGFGTGFYGTLIGAGGGFVLMPLLLFLYPAENPQELTGISLPVVFFNALSGSETYAFQRRIDYKSGLLIAGTTVPGAILGSLSTGLIPRRVFDTAFGVLLVGVAVLLLLRPQTRKAHRPDSIPHSVVTRHMVEAEGRHFDYQYNPWTAMGMGLFVGFLSSLLGIGGGIMLVPALMYLLNFPIQIATATSQFVLIMVTFTATLVHIYLGTVIQGVHQILSLAIGVVLGAQLGAQLSDRIKGNWILRGLAIGLGLVGIRFLAAYL
jgi:uncharacterized membrane protein YfcA